MIKFVRRKGFDQVYRRENPKDHQRNGIELCAQREGSWNDCQLWKLNTNKL